MSYIWQHSQLKHIRVIDGDTIDVEIDMGFRISTHQVLRFARINCPERKEKEPYQKALDYTKAKLESAKEIKLVTYYQGKFGRYLCDVFCDGTNLNKELLEKGLAKPYTAKAKPYK